MKAKRLVCFLLGTLLLLAFSGCKSNRQLDEQEESEEVTIPYFDEEDQWYFSVKGHVNPDSLVNNETRAMDIELGWLHEPGKGKVEMVRALKKVGQGTEYVDIHTGEHMELALDVFNEYWSNIWYLQINSKQKVVEPLLLQYYFNPHFVYEGDLDQDGVPDFGFLMTRHSNLCLYALLTIKDGHWVLLTEPFDVAYNLRASGYELARKGDKKGEIKITRSSFDDDGLSTFMAAQIKDTVVVAKRIVIGDSL